MRDLEQSFSITTEYPGDFFANLMSVITFYGSYWISRDCKESDIEAYSLLATKQMNVCGGEDYFQRWLDDDFARQMTYHNIAARFHGGHYEEAG